MGTIVDSLVVELGLDPTKFNLQQREAVETAKRLESQQVKAAKNIEHESGKAASAINGLRTQALSMLAVFTGGQGLIRFGEQLTHANAQLGRLERNIGVSASVINQWQGAARIFGGSAEQMAQSYTTLSDAFAGFKIGAVTPLIAELHAVGAAGGHIIDVYDSVEESFRKLSANLKSLHDRDPATAGLMGRRLGLDPAFFDLLIQGPSKLQAVLDYVKKIGVATSNDVDAFGELEKRMSQIGLKAESLGRKLLGGENGLASKIIRFADWLNLSPGEAWDSTKGWLGGLFGNPADRGGQAAATAPAQKLFGGVVGGGGIFKSQAEKEAYIRAAFAKWRVNPNVAMAVSRAEGFNSFQSTVPVRGGPNGREDSWGAFQLYMRGGLGNEFQKKTGLDPRDPANERATIDFAAEHVAKHGWGAFHGAKNIGISRWQGVGEGGAGNTSSTEVNIGTVVVQPKTDTPNGWASEFANAVKNRAFAAQANAGQN